MSTNLLRVHAADSDVLSLLAIEHLFSQTQDIQLEQVSSTGTEAVERAVLARPDVLLMETNISDVDSLTATQQLTVAAPEVKVVFLSTVHDAVTINQAYSAGANSYLAKNTIVRELASAMRLIALNNNIFSSPSDRVRMVTAHALSARPQEQIICGSGQQTKRLLIALAMGWTNQEIAAKLHISAGTVKAHIAKVMSRLNITNRVQLAVLVTQAGLLDEDDYHSLVS